jgi:hypothetical protein
LLSQLVVVPHTHLCRYVKDKFLPLGVPEIKSYMQMTLTAGLYKLNLVYPTHSLKAPRFNHP